MWTYSSLKIWSLNTLCSLTFLWSRRAPHRSDTRAGGGWEVMKTAVCCFINVCQIFMHEDWNKKQNSLKVHQDSGQPVVCLIIFKPRKQHWSLTHNMRCHHSQHTTPITQKKQKNEKKQCGKLTTQKNTKKTEIIKSQ